MPSFPNVRWKRDQVTFHATKRLPRRDAAPAVLVFPFYGDRVILADIEGRGWCVPSGHVEAGETFAEAARREAYEEAGLTLAGMAFIGSYRLTDIATGAVRFAPTFVADVLSLAAPPAGFESRGAQMVAVEDVAASYFAWDALLATTFAYAYEEKQRRFRAGIPLSALMET